MEKEKKVVKQYSLIDVALIVVTILGLMALIFFGYKYFTTDTNSTDQDSKNTITEQADNSEEPEEEESSEEVTAKVVFIGDYLTADLPEGWSIVEYKNGVNIDYLVGGTIYTGLTGFAILDETSTVAFKAHGANGVGGTSYCENYYKFSEYSSVDYNAKVATNADLGEGAPTIVDFTTTSYSQFQVLGTTWRRIGNQFYLDTVNGIGFFETACDGLSMVLPTYNGLSFDAGGYATSSYMTEIMLGITETTKLLLLDGVLNSLHIK